MHRSLVRETLSQEERKKVQRGHEKKLSSQQQLAKAASKTGISQFAITIDQLKAAKEEERQREINAMKPKIVQSQQYRQVKNLFCKLELLGQEQKKDTNKTRTKQSQIKVIDELKEKIKISDMKAKTEFFKCREDQSNSKFIQNTMRYSNLFMKSVYSNTK